MRLRDSDRRAEPGRLDEAGIAERVVGLVAGAQRDVRGDRDAVVAEHGLEDVLVHAERRGEHARADVRDAGELEQALHRAVLAERARAGRERRRRRRPASRRRPSAAGGRQRPEPGSVSEPVRDLRDLRAAPTPAPSAQLPARSIATVNTSWPARLERPDHASRGRNRDVVLARAPAQDDGDPPQGVGWGSSSCPSWSARTGRP